MINVEKLFPIVRKAFPQGTDEMILQKLKAFAEQHPELTDQQGLAVLEQVLQHPNVQKAMKPKNIKGYLGAK